METNGNTLIVGLLALLLGSGIGYFAGAGRSGIPAQSGMHGAMIGMTQSLEGKTGDALDKAFLDEMIVHHEGAVEMAQTLLKGTFRPELIKLGTDIIAAQTQEIEMMKRWRNAWFEQ